jgi:hypothetical protein
MLVPLGLWVGIIGYTVLYSGVIKLGGGQCSLAQAFRGQCVPSAAGAKTTSTSSSSTAQSSANAQLSGIPSTPVGMA